MGGVVIPSLFLCPGLSADTITLKNGKDLKGLVVEQHADRIILSTEKGEIPILLKGIKNIKYDNPEQNFMQVGRAYEAEGKLGEALAYYEKALDVNPDFNEAKDAAAGVRNRFWASSTEGPRSEMEKEQTLYDSWGQGRPMEAVARGQEIERAKLLQDGLGLTLEKKGDWGRIKSVGIKKPAAAGGLKRGDRLVSIDAQSLRYLSTTVVVKDLLLPHYSNFTLGFERDCFVSKEADVKNMKDLGFDLKLVYDGLIVDHLRLNSPADAVGLKENDLVTHVNGVATRYMPLKKVYKLILETPGDKVAFTIRRSALLARR